jgi:hypothetical protein
MTAVAAPFGLRPIAHGSGDVRPSAATIASGYANAIYKGSPVKMLSDGTIGVAAVGDAIVGSFQGCEYIDASGKPSGGMWPAGQVATNIVAYITRDPNTVYEIQSAGSIAQVSLGECADFATGAAASGNAQTGLSTASISATMAATTGLATLQIVGFGRQVNNAPGDSFTIVHVRIAKHQLQASVAGGV